MGESSATVRPCIMNPLNTSWFALDELLSVTIYRTSQKYAIYLTTWMWWVSCRTYPSIAAVVTTYYCIVLQECNFGKWIHSCPPHKAWSQEVAGLSHSGWGLDHCMLLGELHLKVHALPLPPVAQSSRSTAFIMTWAHVHSNIWYI